MTKLKQQVQYRPSVARIKNTWGTRGSNTTTDVKQTRISQPLTRKSNGPTAKLGGSPNPKGTSRMNSYSSNKSRTDGAAAKASTTSSATGNLEEVNAAY